MFFLNSYYVQFGIELGDQNKKDPGFPKDAVGLFTSRLKEKTY